MSTPLVDPDTTDWVAVSWDGCEQCGFQPVAPDRIPGCLRDTIQPWLDALRRPDAARRPSPGVWSTLEYACHVRDICGAFTDRLARVLAVDGATCPEFDSAAAAVEGRYAEQDPGEVAEDLALRIELIARRFIDVGPLDWGRRGRRSDGPAFTPASMSNHFLHELEHHLHDVRPPSRGRR